MAKEIAFYDDLRISMQTGMNKTADTIRPALGPLGRSVLMEIEGRPAVTGDGGSVTKDFALKDSVENMGAQIICKMTEQVKNSAGDGMTTAVVLAQAMINDGMHCIAAGANPIELKKGMQGAVQLAARAIQKLAVPVQSNEQIRQAASVASGDEEIAELIVSAYERVGQQGLITVDESGEMEAALEVSEGMQFERGYLDENMVTDGEAMIAELSQPYILITDKVIENINEISHILQQVVERNGSLLIIAEDVKGSALGGLILNKKKGILQSAAVKAPAYGEGRRARMEDIAVYTNGVFVTEELGYTLEEVTIDMLGRAENIRVERKNTVIFEGAGNPLEIAGRIRSLRNRIEKTESEFDKKNLEERIAKLAGGAALIHVGGASEVEIKERVYRARHALCTVRSALSEGIVQGGGTVYLHMYPAIKAYAESLSGDRKTGAAIVAEALKCPMRQIADNGGYDGNQIVHKVLSCFPGKGFNVRNGEYADMKEYGIVDSARSARLALLCAVSCAAIFLTSEAGISEI